MMNMTDMEMGCKLVADGGSTKVDWAVCRGGEVVKEFVSGGMNPLVTDEAALAALVEREVMPQLAGTVVDEVRYYGAGCRGEGCRVMERVLAKVACEGAVIKADSDMAGACRGVLGREPGVMCILGTGANSCLYDGRMIVGKVASTGYVLGDEGSGAWLGKRLVADVLQDRLPDDLCRMFYEKYGCDDDEIIGRVYRPAAGEVAPNRYLASFAPFLSENIGRGEIRAIVEDGFSSFFERCVMPYFSDRYSGVMPSAGDLPVCFTGSVAVAFEEVLRAVAERRGLSVGVVVKSPMSGLAREYGF